MKTTISTAIAFVLAVALYAYGSLFPTHPNDPSPPQARQATSPQSCNGIFLRSKPPTVPTSQAEDSIAICRIAYSSYNSPKTRTPIWSAEELSPGGMRAASEIERDSTFEEESAIPIAYRARLDDYRGSGWDRGHLAPSADMPSRAAQQESFSLSNIVPQAPGLNRGQWADLESDVRSLARRRDAVHVVTGILITGSKVATLPGGRVIIPDQIWKAVASPLEGTVVFLAENRDGAPIHALSLDAFRKSTGIDPFPGATPEESTNMLRIR